MSLKENNSLTIQTLDDLLRCLNLASSLELLGWPKYNQNGKVIQKVISIVLIHFKLFFYS